MCKSDRLSRPTLSDGRTLRTGSAADLAAGRNFALITRSRQQEELYNRALYALFTATPEEVAHIMSDWTPNSFSLMYRAVNKLVFEGRGILEVPQPDLTHGLFYCGGHDQP